MNVKLDNWLIECDPRIQTGRQLTRIVAYFVRVVWQRGCETSVFTPRSPLLEWSHTPLTLLELNSVRLVIYVAIKYMSIRKKVISQVCYCCRLLDTILRASQRQWQGKNALHTKYCDITNSCMLLEVSHFMCYRASTSELVPENMFTDFVTQLRQIQIQTNRKIFIYTRKQKC